jgi:3-methyladenine DNA glycosylase AlkC
MAGELRAQFGASVPRAIAAMIRAVHQDFPQDQFLRDALAGYGTLSLTARAAQIAEALHRHLPADYPRALDILLASASQEHDHRASNGMSGFLFMPHLLFVARQGLDHFEESMRAQHALTQRFTAEFSIRAFLEKHPERTLAQLRTWTQDSSHHVRRLVSEGTRPRLPWAPRLRAFQRDPRLVLELLELLKDDPDPYVRRSVANNLNDIGKDHPALLNRVATRWLRGAGAGRRWIVSHALRSAVKRADAGALRVLGYGRAPRIRISEVRIEPPQPRIGGRVHVSFGIRNTARHEQRLLVDLVIHFVKARGASAKTFKLKCLELLPGVSTRVGKAISLRQQTTRRHYPGMHRVDALVNGERFRLGSFQLRR